MPTGRVEFGSGRRDEPIGWSGSVSVTVPPQTKNRKLSAAMRRSFENYSGIHPVENEL